MTRATEELRRLLDERGVEYSDHYLSTTWRDGHGILHLAGEPMADGSLVVDMLTPEQAIAATLGSEPDETELVQTYDAGFENGVMAVFQQLEGIESYEELQDFIAEVTEAEAIAAWNARAERTCYIEHPYYGDVPVINGQPRCSECKTEFAVGTFPNYCPNCGAKVVE